MKKEKFYHVVTEQPMVLNQIINFNTQSMNGVARRVEKVNNLRNKTNLQTDLLDDMDKIIMNDLERWSEIANRELTLEKIRTEQYMKYPSRMASLYVSRDLEDAKNWADYFISIGRKTYQLVELECEGQSFTGDARNCWYECSSEEEAIKNANHYWENKTNCHDEAPIYETIIDGKIEVVKIIKDYTE